MSGFIGTSSMAIPDRRVLFRPALEKDQIVVVSEKTNQDAGAPRASMLRPGNALLKHASDGKFYDDLVNGAPSTQASVTSLEAPHAGWQGSTVTLSVDGVVIVAVVLGGADDTQAEVIAVLNGNTTFRAHAIASDGGSNKVKVTLLEPGAEHEIKVSSSLAAAFGAAGQSAFGTDGEWVVTTEYADHQDPLGNVKDARVHAVRAGIFDESNLVFGGASALPQDLKRVLRRRGSRFE